MRIGTLTLRTGIGMPAGGSCMDRTSPVRWSRRTASTPGGIAMKARITTCVLLLSVVPGLAMAAQPPATQIGDIASATGLTERQVQMVFGGHTAYAEYLTTY